MYSEPFCRHFKFKMQDSFIRNVITQEAVQIPPCDSSRIRIAFAGISVSSFGKQGIAAE